MDTSPSIGANTTTVSAAWRNGIASDYESGDCRFDPCGGHFAAASAGSPTYPVYPHTEAAKSFQVSIICTYAAAITLADCKRALLCGDDDHSRATHCKVTTPGRRARKPCRIGCFNACRRTYFRKRTISRWVVEFLVHYWEPVPSLLRSCPQSTLVLGVDTRSLCDLQVLS